MAFCASTPVSKGDRRLMKWRKENCKTCLSLGSEFILKMFAKGRKKGEIECLSKKEINGFEKERKKWKSKGIKKKRKEKKKTERREKLEKKRKNIDDERL